MKKILILAVACALVSGAALAVWNAQDVVPAATLLVPYAVVDVTTGDIPDPTGFTTLFAVINVSAVPQIVHMTVWNALSEPVVDWDVLLTGYDVWTINFADMLNGRFDRFDTKVGSSSYPFGSAAASGYTFAGPQPYGPSSNTNAIPPKVAPGWFTSVSSGKAAGCRMPYGDLTGLGATIRRKIREAEISIEYQYYHCVTSGTNYEVNNTWTANMSKAPLFFYVTADVVNACTTTFQNTDSYWQANINAKANVITGDVLFFNSTKSYSEMMNAVHLEALPFGVYNTAQTPFSTFYTLDLRIYTGLTNLAARDDREPLGNAYAFRYAIAPQAITSNVIVWKSIYDLGMFDDGSILVFACEPYYYYAWNEDEMTKSTTGGPSGFNTLQPNAIPYQTQSVPLNLTNFPGLVNVATPGGTGAAGFGWIWIVFDGGERYAWRFTPAYPLEAWVGVVFQFGNYASLAPATLMNNPWNFGLYLFDNPKPF
jgi:hypothetical protein